MIVPKFWAEARIQHRENGRQVTVRRFGWSNASQDEAQAMADTRTQDAFERIWRGEKLPRREPKVPYNGAEGVPIREEILGEFGDMVITRNSYGAKCLNTPSVLFADVDFATGLSGSAGCRAALVGFVAGLSLGIADGSFKKAVVFSFLGMMLAVLVASILRRLVVALQGGQEKLCLRRIERSVSARRDWRARIYRTPAGFRVMAVHRTFDPTEPEVAGFFTAIGTDPLYAKMCLRQRCFRARVSPKPWRVGIGDHLRPRPGVWPVAEEALPARAAWVQAYEERSQGFSACRFVSEIGSGGRDETSRVTQRLHDELCRAESHLPIA